MRANETHISLETAKLLKNCEVESEYWYLCIDDGLGEHPHGVEVTKLTSADFSVDWARTTCRDSCRAYSWQEIEGNANKFFNMETKESYCYELSKMKLFLQQKKYEEADIYFRENCILINRY